MEPLSQIRFWSIRIYRECSSWFQSVPGRSSDCSQKFSHGHHHRLPQFASSYRKITNRNLRKQWHETQISFPGYRGHQISRRNSPHENCSPERKESWWIGKKKFVNSRVSLKPRKQLGQHRCFEQGRRRATTKRHPFKPINSQRNSLSILTWLKERRTEINSYSSHLNSKTSFATYWWKFSPSSSRRICWIEQIIQHRKSH